MFALEESFIVLGINMSTWFDNSDPRWWSLGPLIFINAFALCTVLVYAAIRKRNPPIPAIEELDKRHHSKFLNRWFKEYWFWVTSPVEKIALKFGLTPNFFTTLGFCIAALAGFFYFFDRLGLAGWCVIIGGTCDMFDGRIARLTKKSSASGAFYDSVMDRFGEMVTFIGLAAHYHNTWVFYFVVLSIIGSMMVSYARARGESVGVNCQEGTMQRPERIVYLGVGSIFSPVLWKIFSSFIPALRPDFLLVAAIVMIGIMTNFTAIHRTLWIYRELDKKK